MTECPTRKRPPTPGALPTTTIWARSSSTPDEHDATLAGIADGAVVGTVVQDPYLYGYESVRLLCNLARGNTASIPLPGAGNWALQCTKVTKDNLDEYRKKLEQRGKVATAKKES